MPSHHYAKSGRFYLTVIIPGQPTIRNEARNPILGRPRTVVYCSKGTSAASLKGLLGHFWDEWMERSGHSHILKGALKP